MSDLIREAITEHFGERCPDFEPECFCCKAWAEYDALKKELETAREDALEEAAKIAEAMPVLRPISTAHVKSTTPKDVADAIRALNDKEVAG